MTGEIPIRVFPRRTNMTPADPLAFIGDPPLFGRPEDPLTPVRISCLLTWDILEAERLCRSWSRFYKDVRLGGPAFNARGEQFTPGLFVKEGAVITSRGCIRSCRFCLVPRREGSRIRELEITHGYNVLDNNLLACSEAHIRAVFDMLDRQRHPAVFSGGLDSRLLRPWHIDLLKSIRVKSMFLACDTADSVDVLRRAADLLSDFSREKKRCYVLIGFDGETPTQALRRLEEVYRLGFLPYAMLYRGASAATRNTPEFHDLVGRWRSPGFYRKYMASMTGSNNGGPK